MELRHRESVLVKELPIEERKLVEVGRVLAANPKILMLDEPMAGLNPTEISKFVDLMKKLNSENKLTIVIVEHVMKAISSCLLTGRRDAPRRDPGGRVPKRCFVQR